ncbi:SRPBCC domain-containing protein [Sphingomonas sp. 28-62-11]|uniref:SRPBCC domain-containing protein n=1 Tax=Sphingomonas sp. 28-62-11 TaxID=1970432 RepID=UPI0035A8CC14
MDRLVEWWCPNPWSTEVIENDMRAGGRSAMIMRGPNGEESAMEGVFLEVVPGERVVCTNAFTAGWVPQTPFMVGIMTFNDEDGKTRFTGIARHWDEASMHEHAAMGFGDGWAIVAAQLDAVARDKR